MDLQPQQSQTPISQRRGPVKRQSQILDKRLVIRNLQKIFDYISEHGCQQLKEEQINQIKNIFKESSPELNEIPMNVKNEICKELKCKVIKPNQVILDPSMAQSVVNIYIIAQGQVVIAPSEQEVMIIQHFKNKFNTSLYQTMMHSPNLLNSERKPSQKRRNQLSTPTQESVKTLGQNQQFFIQDYDFLDSSSVSHPFSLTQQNKIDTELLDKMKGVKSFFDVLTFLIREQRITLLSEGEAFGNYYPITGNSWQRSYVYAETDTNLIELDNQRITQLIEMQNENQNHKQLISFLQDNILGFDKVSRLKRDRLARSFKEKTLPPGFILVQEGEHQIFAYIILEGSCLIVSKKNPLLSEIDINGQIQTLKKKMMLKKGYMSNTVNQFKIGSLSAGQWVAQDIIIPSNSPVLQTISDQFENPQIFNYSVVTENQVKVLEISMSDMKLKLPRDFMLNVESSYKERKNWKTIRLMDIQKTSQKIYNTNQNIDAYQEAIENVHKLHSQASAAAQSNFRNRFLQLQSPIQAESKGQQLGNPNAQRLFDNYNLRKRNEVYDKSVVDHKNASQNPKKTIDINIEREVKFVVNVNDLRKQTTALANNYLKQKQDTLQQYKEKEGIFNQPNLSNNQNFTFVITSPQKRELKSALYSPNQKQNSIFNLRSKEIASQSNQQTPQYFAKQSDYIADNVGNNKFSDCNKSNVSLMTHHQNGFMPLNSIFHSQANYQEELSSKSMLLRKKRFSQDSQRPMTSISNKINTGAFNHLPEMTKLTNLPISTSNGFYQQNSIITVQLKKSKAKLATNNPSQDQTAYDTMFNEGQLQIKNDRYKEDDHRKVYLNHSFTLKSVQNRQAKRYFMPIFKIQEQKQSEKQTNTDRRSFSQIQQDFNTDTIQKNSNSSRKFQSSQENLKRSQKQFETLIQNLKPNLINQSQEIVQNSSFFVSGRKISVRSNLKKDKN